MKKALALISIFVMILGLAACGADPSSTPASPASADPASQAESTPDDSTGAAAAGGTMNVVCTSESYQALFEAFTADTGIAVEFLSMSSGEVLAKVDAEGGSTSYDLWFGGGVDSFMEAKDKGYLEQMTFDALAELAPEYKDPDNYWIAKGITIAGFAVNDAIAEEKRMPLPATWDDLTQPVYRDDVLMSNPAISGTNYAVVNALLQMKGEEAGWAYWEAVNENVLYYSRRGSDPLTKAAAGEVAVGIIPIDRKAEAQAEEFGLTIIYPEDGIPYVPEGVAVFAGSPNGAAAHAFVEWLFSNDENLLMLADIDGKDTAKVVKPGMEGLELTFDTAGLIEVDLALYGTQRADILDRWNVMMGDKAEAE